jgi:predicted RNA-binding protein YlqC (UPF0109 family)
MNTQDLSEEKDLGPGVSGDSTKAPPLLKRKAVLMGLLASSFVIANTSKSSAVAAGTVKPNTIAAVQPVYAPRWAPSTAYTLGQQVVSPDNDVVSAKEAHTSSAAYATDTLKWALSSSYASAGLASDGVIFVSAGAKASDTNDGLSWGKAKASIGAAVTALGSAGTVMIGAGTHTVAVPLANISGVTYRGAGQQVTTIRVTTSLLAPATKDVTDLVFEGLTIVSNAGHMFDLTTVGLVHSVFRDCALWAVGDTKSIVYLRGNASFQENLFENCQLRRPGSSTVPAFDIIDHIGACNGNVWLRCLAHSNNSAVAPFWRIEAAAVGSFAYDNTWQNIIGEQNRGGLIHLYSPQNCTIDSANDYDAVGNYADHIIKHDRTTGSWPRNNRVAGSGPRGGTMAAGKFHLKSIPCDGLVIERMTDALGVTSISLDASNGRVISDSGATITSIRTLTSSGVASNSDAVIVLDGATVTLTLPDPATVMAGRQWTVKNINAAKAAVTCPGHTIDGAPSHSLARWSKATYITDGAQWYIL